ncbi:hypothetical protein DFH09DRAFT_21956 [Mycena vulgaris]|nr:hypothetical protein DFH09DRAFT_21956 [Mycena vulgaris]
MPSHHHRRRNKDPDDEQLPPRMEESHTDPYSRLPTDFRQTSNYRRTESTSSNSGRNSYDMNRASSSRAHRDSNWRPKDAENRYTDDYYREPTTREPESWPAHSVPEPRYSERDWNQRYDAGYSTSTPPYPDPSSSWATPSNTAIDHRNGHQERWQSSHDSRGGTFRARPSERGQTVEQRRDWGRDQRRGKEDQKWASGSGYDSGRAEPRGSGWVEPAPRWNPPPEKTPVTDNRAWEPAPTWQPSGSGERQNHRNHNPRRRLSQQNIRYWPSWRGRLEQQYCPSKLQLHK